jgi:plasmid maintenance system antidote protein VapI
MSDLENYLTDNHLTTKAFADVLGVHQSTVWRLAKRKLTPTLPLALLIEKETGGRVSVASLVADPTQ